MFKINILNINIINIFIGYFKNLDFEFMKLCVINIKYKI